MLSENIKTLRKQKGYSQEQLAEQLNVVRQTVSKWEKGYSVPDAEMLEKIANLFEVPVSALLGNEPIEHTETTDSSEVVKQLAILNEHLARQSQHKRRIISSLLIVLLAAFVLGTALFVIRFSVFAVDHSTHETHHSTSYQYSLEYSTLMNDCEPCFQLISASPQSSSTSSSQCSSPNENCIPASHSEKHSIHHHDE